MPKFIKKNRLKLEDPATYEICVQGYLEEVWADRLANMVITKHFKDDQAPVTTLVGEVNDQSELIGVINGLYELRMPILSLELKNEEV
jgi:hypothetical protein